MDQAPSLESWGPHHVRRVTLNVSYTLSRSETGQPVQARIVAKGEFWVTDALGVERLGFGDGNVSLRTGHTEVDAVVTEHLQGVKCLALKTVVTATRTMAEREPATETVSRTLSDFEDVPVAAARFEVPEGYRNVGMMVMPVIPGVAAVAPLPTQRAMPYAVGRPRAPVTPLAEGAPAPVGIDTARKAPEKSRTTPPSPKH